MDWAPALTAISVAIIAVILTVATVLLLLWFRDIDRLAASLEKLLTSLHKSAGPALASAKDLAEEATRIAGTLRHEAEEITETSRIVRKKVKRATDAIEERLINLDALVEVAQGELEETVLDVAAALRTGMKGASLFRSLRRAARSRKK